MTGLDKIKNIIDSVSPVTNDEWKLLADIIKKVPIKKNDIFLKENQFVTPLHSLIAVF